jgi:tetratricopeptide (TPR) repeat protein
LLSDLGDAQEAIPYLERVARVDPDAGTLHALGSSYAAIGRLDDAVASLSRSVVLDPTRIQAVELLATLLIEQRRPQDALRYLGAANRFGNSSARSFALSSFAHAQMGLADSAIADAVAASRAGRNDADVLRLLGRAMIVIQRADAAEEFFTASLQADSSSAEAFTGLAIIAAARGRNEDAKRFFYRALAADSSYQPARAGLLRLK